MYGCVAGCISKFVCRLLVFGGVCVWLAWGRFRTKLKKGKSQLIKGSLLGQLLGFVCLCVCVNYLNRL